VSYSDILELPSKSDKAIISQTSGIIYVISNSEAEQLLQGLSTPEIRNSSTKLALANLIIAIGAQCSKTESTTVQAESFFFARGQQQGFAGMLEDPNLDLVRAFLLMSFYMLGACRRNAAFMYLGVATQAAVAIGLHSKDSYSSLTTNQHSKRYQVIHQEPSHPY
jgi:hypothetical protein